MTACNVNSSFVYGNNLEKVLIKKALDFAETGKFVWFISPEPITKLPQNLTPPEKEVLKLLTFLYLKEPADVISHLNSVHTWYRIPELIIINDFHSIASLDMDTYDNVSGAFLCSSLIDAGYACFKLLNKSINVIVGCDLNKCKDKNNVQVLIDVYFRSLVNTEVDLI